MKKTAHEALAELGPEPAAFCSSFYDFLHLVDDLYDRDEEVTPEHIVTTLLVFFTQLSSNPFWQTNKQTLMPVIHVGLMGWAASERLKNSEDLENKVASQVLKSLYHEVFFMSAYLVGGFEFAFDFEKKYRSYSFD